MTEEKKKNRGWVKNAAIIFLSVLLVLTFLSNTIMNHSLPEVATKWVESGTINTRIRGQAKITPVETYEVKASGAVKVDGVYIKAGDQVAVDDLLFTLSEGEGTDLTDAENALEELELNYRKALINASEFDYAKENRDIRSIREELDAAIAERDGLKTSDEDYNKVKKAAADAEAAVDSAQAEVNAYQADVDSAQEKLSSVTQGSGDSSARDAAYDAWQEAKRALTEAQNALETAKLLYGADYETLKNEAIEAIKASSDYPSMGTEKEQQAFIEKKLPIYLPATAEKYKPTSDGIGGASGGDEKLYNAYTEITAKEKALIAAESAEKSAKSTYNEADSAYDDANSDNSKYKKYKKALETAKSNLSSAQSRLTAAEKTKTAADKELEEAKAKQEEYKTAVANVKTLETSLSDKLFELEQTQKANNKTSALEQLDISAMRDNIAEQEALVEKLKGGGAGSEIKSKVDGVVSNVSITSGNNAEPDTVLATIEVPGRGYRAEMSVTSEQAKRVTVGDSAEVSYGWGSLDISATLRNIKPDPQNPQQGKLLVFEVTGSDVQSNVEMTFSIGEKSKNYETIVPNSAVRSDSNGSFVLLIVAKSTPLGNRYTATRVDVEVLNKDDVNSAVSGGVTTNDYVITTSTAPVENGQLVRMADN